MTRHAASCWYSACDSSCRVECRSSRYGLDRIACKVIEGRSPSLAAANAFNVSNSATNSPTITIFLTGPRTRNAV